MIYYKGIPSAEVDEANIVNNCAEAKSYFSIALDARDTITTAETLDEASRAKWETLQNEAGAAELLQDRFCSN